MFSTINGSQGRENRFWSKNTRHRVRKATRRNGRARLRLESLKTRTVLDSGSITSNITIINNSGFTLTFAGENFDNGTHDLNARPNSIPTGVTGTWQVGSGSGFLGPPVGVVGSTTSNIGNTGDQDVFNLDFPLVGSDSAVSRFRTIARVNTTPPSSGVGTTPRSRSRSTPGSARIWAYGGR